MNSDSRTSMERLYAVGETSCNGVHGANRLASNSLLESLVFAERSAKKICQELPNVEKDDSVWKNYDMTVYDDYETIKQEYKKAILEETERMRKEHE